jgi:ribosomal protein S18 acetylase RimI-like enzyme
MAVRRGLEAYNVAHSSVADAQALSVFARDANGTVIGGVLGETWGEWLDIWQVWVDPAFHRQGLGSRLLRAAEQAAIARGCRHAQLDTYSFQAPEFYAKQGYEVFGLLEGMPDGHKRFYLRKRLA